MKGAFVISLDFELFWGVRDSKSASVYGDHIIGVREAMPKLLALFHEFQIKATFASVGLLHFESKETLIAALPSKLPQYSNSKYTLTPEYIESVGSNETIDPIHFGASLIKQIQAAHMHEIGTHTFSHYYTLEEGAEIESFRLDLKAAKQIALNNNITFQTIIFPRNQYNSAFLEICKQEGLRGFRGTENSWIYKPLSRTKETKWRRLVRFLDAYINISGNNTHKWSKLSHKSGLYNIPASRFLRPYSHSLRIFEHLRLKRILNAMTHAAINEQIFHLWWHPHNFGKDVEKNLLFLRSILEHQKMLHNVYGFESHTMNKCYSLINNHEQ